MFRPSVFCCHHPIHPLTEASHGVAEVHEGQDGEHEYELS